MSEKRAGVFVLEDQPIVRSGITELIGSDENLSVVGEAGSFREAMERTEVLSSASLILFDISLPDKRGLDAIREFRESYPETKILVLSMHDENMLVSQVLQAGANGYMMKDVTGNEILDGIHSVLRGRVYLSEAMRSQMLGRFWRGDSEKGRGEIPELTRRERQIFEGIGEGKSVKQIAAELGIGSKTVETHRARIKGKLGLASNTDLIRYAAHF